LLHCDVAPMSSYLDKTMFFEDLTNVFSRKDA
jgi:hypothetical protein